jgi:uncharacterized protein YoxC
VIPFVAILAFAILYLVVFFVNDKIHVKKLLKEHQLEWDKIKQELVDDGKTEAEISEKYAEYIVYLWETRDTKYGACLPHQ